jgi:hypothetical protein
MMMPFLKNLIQEQGTKIYIYFGVREYNEDYDPYNKNVDYVNLNPHVIMGYVQMISPEKLVWKQYGLQEMGAVEVLCESRYKDWFKTCTRVVINGEDYSVFKVGNGKRVLIQDRPGNMIRVVLEKKG